MASLDVKNTAGGDTGNSQRGRIVLFTGGRGSSSLFKQTQEDPKPQIPDYDINNFDNGSHRTLKDRIDDPTYYG